MNAYWRFGNLAALTPRRLKSERASAKTGVAKLFSLLVTRRTTLP
ncbi:hypothetical protein PLANPX_3974 [Lacipirellula parvula]|uniref:Uncharacterized protein n=1 Tax=Lacipirellula parvula TaxID=2650471 RepID=A0A5K7XEC0_9BACT|nr:hypothetical protein PLANPX_3974 [Lacipirellula parvula]